MIDINDIDTVTGATAYDRDGDKVGRVGQVYVSEDGRQALFATVKTGLFGTKESFVPLQGASLNGDELRLQYDKDTIKGAPSIDDDGALSDDEQGTIFDYYDGRAGGTASGVGGTTAGLGSGLGGDRVDDDRRGFGDDRDDDRRRGGDSGFGNEHGTVGHDTSGPTTDDAMTRSEERLNVGTERAETGRARLRKHVVTDRQTVTVPVTHEEVRIEREPITDANRASALGGPDLSDEEHEVVLTEERPVVDKETVPVERVRLDKEQVTENRQVTEDVRHEEITTDDDASRTRR